MGEAEVSRFLCILIKMGEALQNSGAEVFRVEDTLNRIAAAYGAQEVNVFVITSSIVVTLTMPQLPPQTQTRRLRHASGNDLLMLEELNALSRRICAAPPSVEEFQRQLDASLPSVQTPGSGWRAACWPLPALPCSLGAACGTACWPASLQCWSSGWSAALHRSA